MKETNGAQAATDEHPGAPKVAPRFTRAVNAERSRLEGKEGSCCSSARRRRPSSRQSIEPVQVTDELLELLTPLLAANGNEPRPPVKKRPAGLECVRIGRASARRLRAAIAYRHERPGCERDISAEAQPAKE